MVSPRSFLSNFQKLFRAPLPDILFLLFLVPLFFGAKIYVHFSSSSRILQNLQRVPKRAASSLSKNPGKEKIMAICRLVEIADKALGGPACLRRALVLSWLSCFFRWSYQLKIGAAKNDGTVELHTWLELDGLALETQRYQQIPFQTLTPLP